MKRNKLVITILLLVAAIGILTWLNQSRMESAVDAMQKETLLVRVNDIERDFSMEELKELPLIEFNAIQDTSDSGPKKQQFKGIPLKDIVAAVSQGDIKATKVIVKGTDGYTVAMTVKEALMEDNTYLCIEKNGKPMGRKSEGGCGPYQLIIRQDMFSQRWCKFVYEVIVE